MSEGFTIGGYEFHPTMFSSWGNPTTLERNGLRIEHDYDGRWLISRTVGGGGPAGYGSGAYWRRDGGGWDTCPPFSIHQFAYDELDEAVTAAIASYEVKA